MVLDGPYQLDGWSVSQDTKHTTWTGNIRAYIGVLGIALL